MDALGQEKESKLSPRFVIFASYGNDSCALIQWAHEWKLTGVHVVYSDTGWAADGWEERVVEKEAWARSLGFTTQRTTSIGFMELARQKKGFPTQKYQWCSFVLKIEPGMKWLAENDPEAMAICIVGARREEAKSKDDSRATFPEWLPRSENHGGRFMLAPFALITEAQRDEYLARAGVEPLNHRSRECTCINSNRRDFIRYTPRDVDKLRDAEADVGKNIFRPKRHMGARGIDEVMKWAHSPRGKYVPPEPMTDVAEPDAVNEEDSQGCDNGSCER